MIAIYFLAWDAAILLILVWFRGAVGGEGDEG